MKLNYLAIIVTAVLSLGLGFVWFNLLFEKTWNKIMNYDPEIKPEPKAMAKSFAIFIIGALFTSGIYAVLVEATRLIAMFGYLPKGSEPLILVLAIWLGFYLPNSLGRVSWENKGWNFVVINSGFDLVRLCIMTLVFWVWR